MAYTIWAQDVDKRDLKHVGGKGANLGEMLQAGIPVPPAFIITSEAYFAFVKENKLADLIKKTLSKLNPEDTKALNQAAAILQKTILKKPFSPALESDILEAYAALGAKVKQKNPLVAVRSSATAEDLPEASFAGQQSTFLNITGEKDLLKAVREAYASLFEPRSIYYRIINNFDHLKVGIAIPVQKMVQSTQSGILFTLDPITNNQDVIVIDAILGLGEAIVSGAVTPDHYVVEKGSLKITDKQIGRQAWQMVYKGNKNIHISLTDNQKGQQKITDDQVLELARISKQIETHYKFPQDTEWAIETDPRSKQSTIYFVQSRPITTMKSKPKRIIPLKVETNGTTATMNPGAPGELLLKGVPASVGVATGKVQIITKIEEIEHFEEGNILVAEMTNPSYVPAMRKASGIVTDAGGQTSHAAIISREIGIPAIVGTGQATHRLKDGQMITIDGAKGLVYKGTVSSQAVIKDHKETSIDPPSFVEEIPVTATKVYVNLAEADEAKRVAGLPVDGVGLLRAEFMIAGMQEHPVQMLKTGKAKEFVEKLTDGIVTIASTFKPRQVVYRASDFKTNE